MNLLHSWACVYHRRSTCCHGGVKTSFFCSTWQRSSDDYFVLQHQAHLANVPSALQASPSQLHYTIMACGEPQTSGSGATWKIGDNLLLSTVLLLAALPYRVVSRKVQFLAHCFLFCTLMIWIQYQKSFEQLCLQMTPICLWQEKTWMKSKFNWMKSSKFFPCGFKPICYP